MAEEKGTRASSAGTGISPPAISLPKGGGAIRGIGEKFAANPVTGTGSMTVPIATSPGRSGFGPQLSLSYDSGAGNGPFGFGWGLSLPSITRKTDKGLPQYQAAEESDVFILSGAEDLVPVLQPDGTRFADNRTAPGYIIHRYRPRIEGLFARIERWTKVASGEIHWRSITGDNVTTWYGKDGNSRIFDPADPSPANPTRIFSWLICESYDDKGNAIVYEYAAENDDNVDRGLANERHRVRTANRYLKRIKYGNRVSRLVQPDLTQATWMFEVIFDYDEAHCQEVDLHPSQPKAEKHEYALASSQPGSIWAVRPDPFSTYRAGFEVRTYRRCCRVLMFHHIPDLPTGEKGYDGLVRSTEFDYADLDYSQSVAIKDELAHQGSTRFASFIRAVTQSGYVREETQALVERNGIQYATYLKKSLPRLEFEYSKATIQDRVLELDAASMENLPVGLDGATYQWVDLDGEGVSGILTEQSNFWSYKPNLGEGRFGPLETVAAKPSLAALSSGRQQLLDLAGDGQLDLVALAGPTPGFYERTFDEDWAPFRTFRQLPNIPWDDPNLRFVDLNGDGHADVLITEHDVFTWHPSLGEAGFSPAQTVRHPVDEERGPRLVLADGTQSIYLADMCGDGLTDLVRICNGEVCYWPNLGYGRFGAKITMDNAPWFDHPDQFDQRRLRLADIDGSGTNDIIYLARDGVRLYFNQSGNRLSGARPLASFPHVNNVTSIMTADLLGNGTACLVWSSPLPADSRRPLRYIDLMGGTKPHLLIKSANNLGAETQIHYAPSTRFYLADKRNGRPWVTRLPFPVHVVERVVTHDRVSGNQFVTGYAYHHGYFDGIEREFRGFGMVEQWDTEAFEDYVVGVRRVEADQELARELYQPPVTTRTWYHTGAFLHRDRILHQFRNQYYKHEQHIPDPALPGGLDAHELHECLRALKGLPLRQEIYSFDGSPQEQHPYRVVENTFELRVLQPRRDQKHAVFFPIGRESVTLNYERNPADPRIAQTFSLEVDEYGNVRKSCAVVYGRKIADPTLPIEVIRDQQKVYVTYAETDYTSDIDQANPTHAYRLRIPYDSRSYEITGIAPIDSLFQFHEIQAQIAGAADIAYEVTADDATPQKRLLSHGRTLFLDNTLNSLPLGQWDSLGLVHQSHQLAFTLSVSGTHYAGNVSDVDFRTAGYIHSDGDADWWIPSGTAVYAANPADHFYLPIGSRDPLGVETIATLDKYDLLVERVQIIQAAWDETTVVNDYRVLGPVLMTDPNKNRSAVELDALGMVVKTAIMGKAGSSDGDTLADPTVEMDYELFCWMNNRKPNFVHTLAREEHGVTNRRWQESYAYSNGGGGVAMVKAKVNAGKARLVNGDGTVTEVDADPRWVGNGRTILNNKGNPVKQYEPYFSTTHEYEDEKILREIGVTPILYYDAVGRNVRTQFPNRTFARVEFDPWMRKVFDANDTVRESQWYADRGSPNPKTQPEPLNDPEHRAAWLAAKHADTPGVTHFNSLGRPIYAISDYGGGITAAVRSESDLTARLSKIFDQHQREVASGFTGMAGHPIVGQTAEKGRRWLFQNVLGALVKTWNEHGRRFRIEYDSLHRPVSTFVQEAGQAEILFNYVVYGDRLANAEQLNLLGIAHQIFDQAGMVRIPELDFKGNPKSVDRVLAKDYKNNLDWSALPAQADYTATQAAATPSLEIGEVFTASSLYDALNRPTLVTLADGTVIVPTYNEANFLASLRARIRGQGHFIEFLKSQDYDAKGQRQFAHYGNSVLTRYFYEPDTFRLTNLLTYKSGADPHTQGLQNLKYTYDPVGNVAQIRDDAQQTRYFNNAVVTPGNLYEYDAIYQLIRATGREHAGLGSDTIRTHTDLDFIPQLPHPNNADAVRNYIEEYEYDLLGNIKVLKHRFKSQPGIGGGWTGHYRYAFEESAANRTNRLTSTSVPGDPDAGPYTGTYDYDVYGNMTRLPHLAVITWNFMDQLQQVDLGGGGKTYYVYGLGGQRLRKVIERNGNLKLEWIFLGAVMIFRRRRRNTNQPHLQRWTVHISDNTGRIAQVDTKTRDDDNSDPANPLNAALIRYQYANHLGSVVLETDEDGNPISYEECHAYGTAAYRSGKPGCNLSLKRYRFSGKERDDETGLYYFGARYYASWLGRWASSDPAGFIDGLNLFRFSGNNPSTLKDTFGFQSSPTETEERRRIIPPGVDTLREFEAWARGFGIQYYQAPEHLGGNEWRVGPWRRVRPGQGGGAEAPSSGEPPSQSQEPSPSRDPDAPAPNNGASAPPLRPALDPSLPASPTYSTNAIPKLDVTEAPPGTDFTREASAARRVHRQSHGITGRLTAVEHPQKELEGARTNTHPRITNHPRFLHPISNRRGTGGIGDNGRLYATEHTLADRGRYPSEAARTQRRYGSLATERVTTLWAGQQVRQRTVGSRGPLFLREYIVAPMMRGAAGHFSLAATRTFVPFVVEAELGLMGAGMVLYNAGYASAGVAVFGAASYVPVVGGGLVAGAVVGNAAENLAREWGASEDIAQGAGALASVGAGAAVGALIGSVIPGVGTAVGAAVGAVFGLIGYGLSKLF